MKPDQVGSVHDLSSAIEANCPRCGYDLRATITLSGVRCPECGARLPFDVLRHHSPVVAAKRRARWLAVIVFGSIVVLGGLLIALNGPPQRVWLAVAHPALALLAGGGIATLLIIAIPRFGSYRPDYRMRALLLTPVSLVTAILLYRNHGWVLAGICAFSALFALGMIAWRKAWAERAIRAIRRRFARG